MRINDLETELIIKVLREQSNYALFSRQEMRNVGLLVHKLEGQLRNYRINVGKVGPQPDSSYTSSVDKLSNDEKKLIKKYRLNLKHKVNKQI